MTEREIKYSWSGRGHYTRQSGTSLCSGHNLYSSEELSSYGCTFSENAAKMCQLCLRIAAKGQT